MTNKQIKDAYNKISLDPQTAEDIWLRAKESAKTEPEVTSARAKGHRGRNIRRTLLVAAVIASLMTVTAMATDFYGIKTVTREDSQREFPMATTLPDGSIQVTMTPVTEVGGTRPYDGPDWAMEWISKSQSAFAEWQEYRSEKLDAFFAEKMPNIAAFLEAPDGDKLLYGGHTTKDNGDGTYTLTKWHYEEDPETLVPNIWGEMVPDYKQVDDPDTAITVDQAEMDAYNSYSEYRAKLGGYGDYHYIYSVWDAEEAAKLEEIAAKYGLSLRKGESTKFGGSSISNTELNRQLGDAVGTGLIYREAPEFDHYSTFASGSFQSMASIPLSDGRKASTYFCSTAYHEMVDGREVGGLIVREDEPMVTRSYTAADGTELTISQNDTQAIIYAYLDSAYITLTVMIDNWVAPGVQETNFQLDEEIVNYVADFINYKNIGK